MFDWPQIQTTAQMRATESAAMASGAVSGVQLMQRAGMAVAGQIRLRWPKPGRATVLCGPGNNGGDGYVIARHLHRAGWTVRVLGLDNTPGPDADAMKRDWRALGPIRPLTLQQMSAECDLVVDALFGTGLTRAPDGDIARILDWLQSHPSLPVVSVDCPSGLCMDSGRPLHAATPRCQLTVAFDSLKPGHLLAQGPRLCGRLVIEDIGIAPWRDASTLHRATLHPGLNKVLGKQPDSHKYGSGHALIVAGGRGKGGAAQLAAQAALRIGAGLVTICPPDAALPEHAGPPWALMRQSIDDAADLSQTLADSRISAICLGPGCGVDRAAQLLPPLLASGRACVLDADALTALSKHPAALHANCVLTPHMGEFARLFPDLAQALNTPAKTGPALSKLHITRQAAARCGATVLLKGADTVMAAPDGQAAIHSAFDTPFLATAGAGDVLSGLIAGLLARGQTPLAAAALAATLHSAAARHIGPGLIADDIAQAIPRILRDLNV
ncbi:NAD(P)H-hydrate dehydratase [Paracoccus homiensis]|uniref:NAD(P)H-hydrate dehydratase n=1 Tax=Paracoccus homiensis TaxID=364199 RepID=UPI00398CC9AC